MIKVIGTDSFNFDSPTVSLVDVHSRGVDKTWMTKRAAVLVDEIKAIKPEAGHSYIHLISLGAGEYTGANRNGDWFNEKAGEYEFPDPKPGKDKTIKLAGGLEEYHPTFMRGHVFKHHKNTDPKQSIGEIKAAAYNPEMHRGELIIKVPHGPEWDSDLQKMANGTSPAFSMACVTDPNYPVLTELGYKRIEDVVIGDKVLTHSGNWKKVFAVNRRKYTGKICRFELNGLALPLEITADHLMWSKIFKGSHVLSAVQEKANRYFTNPKAFEKEPSGWAHAEHLSVGDRFFYQPTGKISGFAAIDDTRLALLMGYYLAEGSFGSKGEKVYTVDYTCHMNDKFIKIIPKLLNELYPNIDVKLRGHEKSDACVIVSIHNHMFAEFMYNFVGRRCKNKFICPEIFNASEDVKSAFMGSWLDGDGFVDEKGVHWSTANLNLVLQGRDLLASIGIPSSIYAIDHAKCETSGHENSGIEYTLNVSHLEAQKLLKWSEKAKESIVYFSAQKRTKPASMRVCPDGRFAYRIKNVTTKEVVDIQTYNIEVEDDHSYLLAGLISHNCKEPHDTCSICSNVSPTRSSYCDHLSNHMTELTKEGHQVFAINDTYNFFDISKVFRPADRIAWGLSKVASAEIIGGAALAETYGLTDAYASMPSFTYSKNASLKRALAKKLAEIEKTIEMKPAQVIDAAGGCPMRPLDDSDLSSLHQHPLKGALAGLNKQKIVLGVDELMKLLLGSQFSDVESLMPAAKSMLPGMFNRLASGDMNDVVNDETYDSNGASSSTELRNLVNSLSDSRSISVAPSMKRITITILSNGKPSPELLKTSSAYDRRVEPIVREYAKYLLSFVKEASTNGEDEFIHQLTVLRHYLKS